MTERIEESFLNEVLSGIRISTQPDRHAVEARAVTVQQLWYRRMGRERRKLLCGVSHRHLWSGRASKIASVNGVESTNLTYDSARSRFGAQPCHAFGEGHPLGVRISGNFRF